jgi:glycosyltransferase involved in cell wall biosynthesis
MPEAPSAIPLRIMHAEAATNFGGQEHRIFKEMIAMRQAGHHLEAICQPHAKLTTRLRDEGFAVHTMNMDGPLNFIQAVTKIRHILKAGRFDVLNTHSRRDTLIASIAGRLAQTPLIVRTRHLANPINSLLSYTWLPHCVTTDSHFVRDQLIQKGVASERIETIYTPLLNAARHTSSTLRQELDLSDDAVVVGCVAVMRANKGHRELIEAMVPLFKQRPNVHLVIVGSGDPVFQEVTQSIKRLGLQDRIHLLGRREDIGNVMAGFDLFCLATRLEASGMVFLEAASAGLPVIGTAVGGVPEMMDSGKTGLLVELDDPEGLRRALLTLIDDPMLRKQMGEAGYARIWLDPDSPFTPQSLVRQTEKSYRTWLNARREQASMS